MDQLDERFSEIYEGIKEYIKKEEDLHLIAKSYYFAKLKHSGVFRIGGEPYMHHLLDTAEILTDLKAGPKTIVAGLLHDTVEDVKDVSYDLIAELFGEEVAELVDSLTKVNIAEKSKEESKNFTIQKIFLAMSRDVRTIIIKIADRLSNMRTLEPVSLEHKLRVSKQTLEIYAPVARCIGFNKIAREMEELCLFYLEREKYDMIKNHIKVNNEKTREINNNIQNNITSALKSFSIRSSSYKTNKDVYNIYKFMKKNRTLEEIEDLDVIHIITDKNIDCYIALGIIHSIYMPVFGKVKDYISSPKYNMYQGIHTLIITPGGGSVKIAIKTKLMDDLYNYGVASKWAYSEDKGYNKESEQLDIRKYFNIIRELDRINSEDDLSINDYVSFLKKDILNYNQYIYVYTPKGESVVLPMGSSVIDFAFKIHTDIGEGLQKAYINGIEVDLFQPLRNGSIVDLKSGNENNVQPNWLDNIITNYARIKIKRALNKKGIPYGEE